MDIEELYDKIFRFCYYRVGSRETAEDLTQETFLRYMNRSFDECDEGIKYLYSIARNLCIDEYRRPKTEIIKEDISDEGVEADHMINRIHVRQVLETMAEEDRDLLILRFMNNESVTDICKITGSSRFALYRRLKRVKREFISRMEGEDRCE